MHNTHTQGGSLGDPLSSQWCVERGAKSKTEKCGDNKNFRGLRMKWWVRRNRKKKGLLVEGNIGGKEEDDAEEPKSQSLEFTGTEEDY